MKHIKNVKLAIEKATTIEEYLTIIPDKIDDIINPKYINVDVTPFTLPKYSLIGIFSITVFIEGYSTIPVLTMILQFIDNINWRFIKWICDDTYD